MADDSILLIAKEYGLDLARPGEAVHAHSLALLPDPPELSEELQKRLTPVENLRKTPLFPRLIPTNLKSCAEKSPATSACAENPPATSACAEIPPATSACAEKPPATSANQNHEGAVPFRLLREGKRSYQCSACDFVKASRGAVLGHIKRLSNAELETCDCGYATSNPECFRQHKSRCASRFVCGHPNCGFETTRRFVLKRHLVSHSEQRLWKCDFCDATFTLKSNKKRHQQHFHMPWLDSFHQIKRKRNMSVFELVS